MAGARPLASTPEVEETRQWYDAVAWGDGILRVFSTYPESPIQADVSTQMVVRVDVPLYPHGGPGQKSDTRSLVVAGLGSDNGP